jgi:UDP-N-acetylenolpyruvoylglucosamine reductase
VNFDHASSSDIFNLTKFIQEKVFEKFGVTLESEIQLIGF